MKEDRNIMVTATLFEDAHAVAEDVDIVAIERELRLKQESLEEVLSKMEKSKHISPELLKLKISI